MDWIRIICITLGCSMFVNAAPQGGEQGWEGGVGEAIISQSSDQEPDGSYKFSGFQPVGAHNIPTPLPIPEQILKALEWDAAHPEPEQKGN